MKNPANNALQATRQDRLSFSDTQHPCREPELNRCRNESYQKVMHPVYIDK